MLNKITRITIAFPKYLSTGVHSTDMKAACVSFSDDTSKFATWMKNVDSLVKELNGTEFYNDGSIESIMRSHLGVKAKITTKVYTKTRRTYSHNYLIITEETV